LGEEKSNSRKHNIAYNFINGLY